MPRLTPDVCDGSERCAGNRVRFEVESDEKASYGWKVLSAEWNGKLVDDLAEAKALADVYLSLMQLKNHAIGVLESKLSVVPKVVAWSVDRDLVVHLKAPDEAARKAWEGLLREEVPYGVLVR